MLIPTNTRRLRTYPPPLLEHNRLYHKLAVAKARAICECQPLQGMVFYYPSPITNIAKAICESLFSEKGPAATWNMEVSTCVRVYVQISKYERSYIYTNICICFHLSGHLTHSCPSCCCCLLYWLQHAASISHKFLYQKAPIDCHFPPLAEG